MRKIVKNNLIYDIEHCAGFFSCCSVKLMMIIEFINSKKILPEIGDCPKLFTYYKEDKDLDVTYHFFEKYNKVENIEISPPIRYHVDDQFKDYSILDYSGIVPIIKKYFSPSVEINEIINNMEEKYSLDYENTCLLFHRGNDKGFIETKKCGYKEYLNYTDEILKKNPNIVFLIQSDETEFIEFMSNKFPNNSIFFKDEIRHIKKSNRSVDIIANKQNLKSKNYIYSKKYLAITIIMSKCKYIICGSGNCDKWITFYRGNNNNVAQNFNGNWYSTIN